MRSEHRKRSGLSRAAFGLGVWVGVVFATPALAQTPPASGQLEPAVYVAPLTGTGVGPGAADPTANTTSTSGVQQVGCASCDGGLFPSSVPLSGASPGIYGAGRCHRCGSGDGTCNLGCVNPGCGENGCVAGRAPCTTCVGLGPVSKVMCAFRNAINCPDPCYEPKWIPGQNASLFLDSPRPTSQTRFRWDAGRNMIFPDRSEFFWAGIGGKGPPLPETRVDYHTLNMYTEAGTDRFSFFVNLPFRSVAGAVNGGSGGFGDMSLGTKSVLVDSELVLLSFQFTTYLPTGTPGSGLGVGHVSLEPALLSSIKLHTHTWLQSQLAYWSPIGGTPGRAGGVLQYSNSLNHTLFCPMADMSVIGTFETMGMSFLGGSTTPPGGGVISANTTYFSVGPGVRWAFSDKLDFGFGVQFAVTNPRAAAQMYRTELRWRF